MHGKKDKEEALIYMSVKYVKLCEKGQKYNLVAANGIIFISQL